MIGRPPFMDRNHQKLERLILKGKIVFPDEKLHGIAMSEDLKDLITKLLDRDPSYRYHYFISIKFLFYQIYVLYFILIYRLGAKGSSEVISHPWFSDIDFDLLLNKQIEPPFIPKIEDNILVDEEFSKPFI